MASEKLGMAPPHQVHNGLNQNPQLPFPEAFAACGPHPAHHRPSSGPGDSRNRLSTRELTSGFLDHQHYFHQQPQQQAQQPPPHVAQFRHQWSPNCHSRDVSEDDDVDDDDEEEDDDDDDGEETNLDNIGPLAKSCDSNQNERCSANSNQKMKHISAFGIKAGDVGHSSNGSNNENNSSGEMRNPRGGEAYFSQYLNVAEGPSTSYGQKEVVLVENGCGFSGRKEGSYLSESGESLRAILSDPVTGTLMDDAMILPCGHSFGTGGIQQVMKIKACCTCSQPVSEGSIAPNLSLRLAVQAFRREEETQATRTSRKRRERYDRDKGTYGDSFLTDQPRGKGVQFPFSVSDRVIIKGNKRTPQRFVGREAIVTTQCLNGWYVVKTLDNAESVKLQYRSLAKVTQDPSSEPTPIKMTPNWL